MLSVHTFSDNSAAPLLFESPSSLLRRKNSPQQQDPAVTLPSFRLLVVEHEGMDALNHLELVSMVIHTGRTSIACLPFSDIILKKTKLTFRLSRRAKSNQPFEPSYTPSSSTEPWRMSNPIPSNSQVLMSWAHLL